MIYSSLFSLPFFMQGGERRILGCLPPKANRGGHPCYGSVNPLFPRSSWIAIDRRSQFPAEQWILDQGSIGSCVGNGAAAALRKTRFLAGQSDVPLSPGCLYAQINGGTDRGAVISDALTALQTTGTCAYETVGETPFYLSQLPAGWQEEAKRFRISMAYHCQSFDEIMSAIQFGFVAVFGIMVGNDFENFDKYGVAGCSPGPGNHCLHADGCAQLPDGRWVLDVPNSWRYTWGPFGNGRVYLCEDHFLHGDQPDAFVPVSALDDPLEPHEVVKAA